MTIRQAISVQPYPTMDQKLKEQMCDKIIDDAPKANLIGGFIPLLIGHSMLDQVTNVKGKPNKKDRKDYKNHFNNLNSFKNFKKEIKYSQQWTRNLKNKCVRK